MEIISIQFCVSHTEQNKTEQKNKEKEDIVGNMDEARVLEWGAIAFSIVDT